MSWLRTRWDAIIILSLLMLPLGLFWETTLGGKTLIPGDNLYQWEPWASYAEEMGVGVPHNELLSDLVLENYAWKRFVLQSFRQPGGLTDRLPLWNPYLWSGAPFLADGQSSVMYPFSLLFYVMPLHLAYGWFTVLQFWLAGSFMYILARTLGTNRVGGLLAGIVYQLSTVFVFSVVFTMIIAAMVWLPLLLAVIEMVIRQQVQGGSGKTLLYVLGGALALGCQMLAGHPEYTYYTCLVMGFYALARLIQEIVVQRGRGKVWIRLLNTGMWLCLMVALGGGLGAAQFVPLYEYAASSFRQGSASYEQIVGWAFPLRRAIALLIPNFFGNPTHHTWFDVLSWRAQPVLRDLYGNPTQPLNTVYWGIKNAVEGASYLGILPLFLALIAVVGRWRTQIGRRHAHDTDITAAEKSEYSRSRFYVWLFLFVGAFSLSLVFGLPTYRLVFALPFINQLHSPFRWLFPYTLSMAVLSGFGATYLSGSTRLSTSAQSPFSSPSTQRVIGWPILGAGLIGVVLLLAALPFASQLSLPAYRAVRSLAQADHAFESGRMFFMYQWRNVLVFALMLVASGAVLWFSRRAIYLPAWLGSYAVWKPLAVSIVVVDLFVAGYGFNPAAEPRWLTFTPPSIVFLQERQAGGAPFRVITYNLPGEKTLNANGPWLYDLQDARGYGSIISKQYVDYMSLILDQYELLQNRISPIWTDHAQALDSPLLDLLNVRYVITTQEITSPKYRLVYDGEVRIYQNDGCMPRAFTLPGQSVIYTEDFGETVQTYDPRRYVVLDGTAPTEPVPGTAKPATVSSYKNNEVLVEVALDEPGWLILTDSFFPGWRAYIRPFGSGEQAERELTILRHSGNFRAVQLEAGHHTVRFRYTPTLVKVGLFSSFLSGMTLALLLVIWLWRRLVRSGERTDAQRVAKNSVAPIVLQLFNKAIDTAFMMLALRILSPEGAGRYYFVVTIVMYADIWVNFGLNIYLQREIARARSEGNRYLSNAVLLRLGLCLLAAPLLVLFVILWPLFTRFVSSRGWASAAETWGAGQIWALAIFAIGLVPSNISAALTALFQANERMEYPAVITVISTIIKVALGTVALLMGWGIVGLGGASIVTNVVTLAILLALTTRLFFRPSLVWDGSLQREMLRESWPLMINNLLAMAFFKVDVLLLKAMKGYTELGLYSSVAYKLIDAVNVILPSSFTFALFPLISRYADRARHEETSALLRAYKLAVRLLVIVALPLAMTLTTLAYPISSIIGGSGYMPDSAIALQLMVWSIPWGFVNSVTHYVLIALGRQRQLTVTFVVGLAFNVGANVICIPVWGYRASAVIHIASEIVLLAAFYVLIRRDLPSVRWFSLLWRPGVAGAAMGAVGWLLYDVNKLLATLAGLGTYVAVLWAVGVAREPDIGIVTQLIPGLDRLQATGGARRGSARLGH